MTIPQIGSAGIAMVMGWPGMEKECECDVGLSSANSL